MAATYVTMSGATLVFADSEAGLDSAPEDASAQIIGAAVEGVEKSTTIPQTFTDPETDVALPSGRNLALRFLQDWVDPAGICTYLAGVDGKAVFFRLSLPPGATKTTQAQGQCTARVPSFGGEAGQAVEATLSLPAFAVVVSEVTNPVTP